MLLARYKAEKKMNENITKLPVHHMLTVWPLTDCRAGEMQGGLESAGWGPSAAP